MLSQRSASSVVGVWSGVSSARRLGGFCALIGVVAWLGVVGCDDPSPTPGGPVAVFTLGELEGLEELVPCRHSHEHDLRHVRIFVDREAAAIYYRCVLLGEPCDEPFRPGALFVKLEYDREGCRDDEFVGYTATRKLDPGALPEGADWRWQRLDRELRVMDDGAPPVCLRCHIDHCSAPDGYDLRCTPD